MINAVESDNVSDDNNTNTNPTKIKTSPAKTSSSQYSSIKVSHIPKYQKVKENTQFTHTSTSVVTILPTSLNNPPEIPLTIPPYSVSPNPSSSTPFKTDSFNTSSKNDSINPSSNSFFSTPPPSDKMTSFGPPKLIKLPSLKKLTQLSNTPFPQSTSSQTFITLTLDTSPPELNISPVTQINSPPDSPPKTYSTTRVHTTQTT